MPAQIIVGTPWFHARRGQLLDNRGPAFVGTAGGHALVFVCAWAGHDVSTQHDSMWRALAGLGAATSVVLYIWGAVWSYRRAGDLSELQREHRRLESLISGMQFDLFKFWDTRMRRIAMKLNLSGSERISLYRHAAGRFVLLGRYSATPAFNGRGRGMYPEDQGCIARAWQQGFDFVKLLPDPGADPVSYFDRLRNEYGIPDETAAGFAMKSRTLAAIAIESARTSRRAAIIVVESVRPGGVKPNVFKATLSGEVGKDLSQDIDQFEPLLPNPGLARKEGF